MWKSNFGRPTPSTRCCPRGRFCPMAFRLMSTQAPRVVPRVLDEPVGLGRDRVDAVADGEHGVVHVLRVVCADRRRVDAALVISEVRRDVECDTYWPSGRQVVLESHLVALRDIHAPARHADADAVGLRGRDRSRRVERALLVLCLREQPCRVDAVDAKALRGRRVGHGTDS